MNHKSRIMSAMALSLLKACLKIGLVASEQVLIRCYLNLVSMDGKMWLKVILDVFLKIIVIGSVLKILNIGLLSLQLQKLLLKPLSQSRSKCFMSIFYSRSPVRPKRHLGIRTCLITVCLASRRRVIGSLLIQ